MSSNLLARPRTSDNPFNMLNPNKYGKNASGSLLAPMDAKIHELAVRTKPGSHADSSYGANHVLSGFNSTKNSTAVSFTCQLSSEFTTKTEMVNDLILVAKSSQLKS